MTVEVQRSSEQSLNRKQLACTGVCLQKICRSQEFAELVAKKVPDVVVEIPGLGAVVPI